MNNLKIKRAALTFERDKFSVYHKDIIGELNEEIIKLEKEIDSKEGLLKYVSIRIEVYYYTMKEEVESKIKRYSSED